MTVVRIYSREHDTILCTSPRAASTSMCAALDGMPRPKAPEIMRYRHDGARVVMWYRDPVERFWSAERMFNAGPELMDRHGDHFECQIRLHTWSGIFLPNYVLPFDRLAETWPEIFPGIELPHIVP